MEEQLARNTTTTSEVEEVQQQQPVLDRRLVWIMAIACAISVANLYYIQPVLSEMGRSFHVSGSQVGFIATLTQLGYALGLLFIIPLGDRYNRRLLIVGMLVVVALALAATAMASSIPMLAIVSFAVGVTAVVPQLIIPLAASMAAPHERGRIVGAVMSGLLIGVLLARTVSGFVGEQWGWRTMYWIAAVLMILLAVVLRLLLPADRPRSTMNYWQLLRSLGDLIREEPVLRETSVYGALTFGAFSAFWVTLVLFLGTPPYHFGSEVAGLFSLVGVVGASAATFAGRLSDKIDARRTIGLALGIVLLSFVVMWLTGQWLWGLIIGVILLDLGTQANQVSNQSRVYSLNPEARNRLNTIYMVTYFVGGAIGSLLGTYGWSVAGWSGVCGVACLLMLVALAMYAINSRKRSYTIV